MKSPCPVPAARFHGLLWILLFTIFIHQKAIAVPLTNASFFNILPSTYCPDDRWFVINILSPSDAVGPAKIHGEKYEVLNNFSPSVEAPSGTTVNFYEDNGLQWKPDVFLMNPYLLSQRAGFGQFMLSATYKRTAIQYDPTAPGNIAEGATTVVMLSFNFEILTSPVTFNFRTLNNVDGGTICNNTSVIELKATPAGGDYKVNGSLSGLSFVGNKVLLDPKILDYSTSVTYQYGGGTCSKLETELTILPVPDITFGISDGCLGEEIPFAIAVQASTPPPGTYTWQFNNYFWEFGDSPAQSSKAWPPNVPDRHAFQHTGYYTVKLNFQTEFTLGPDHPFGCAGVYEKGVVIKEAPVIDFAWENVCVDQATAFKGTMQGLTTTSVKDILWDLDGTGYQPGTLNANFTYATSGLHTAKFKVTTSNNCFQEKEKEVYKMPVIAASQLPYIENFDTGNGNWLEGTNENLSTSSWTWDAPSGFVLQGDASGSGKAWFTQSSAAPNLHYGLNEKSWVHSPCLDLNEMKSPVLSLNLRSLLQEQIDGVVIQVDSSGKAFDDAEWVTVGTMDETHGWYDHRGIPGNPGNQVLNQYGWSGKRDDAAWRYAAVPLDNYLPALPANRKRMRFRVALGSQNTNLMAPLDGFAFDNFAITERDRIILAEWFTHVSLKTPNDLFNTFSLIPGTDEVKPSMVRLEYHLNAVKVSEEDPLHEQNPSVHNARAAYYGVTNDLPLLVLDGTPIANPFQAPAQTTFDNHALEISKVRFDAVTAQQNAGGEVDVVVHYTVLQPIAPDSRIRVAVVEKVVKNNSTESYYVVRAMLPDVVGNRVGDQDQMPATKMLHITWQPDASQFNDAAALALVAFAQDDNTRQVFQALLMDNLSIVQATITATERGAKTKPNVYPNPADAFIQIETKTPDVKLYNTVGEEMPVAITLSDRGPNMDVRQLPGGVYILRINDREQITLQKVLVVHSRP
ncbi:T9SS type A sorting domain-containing protein [Chryseolinea soli]|uniref:T9SS C-terminal target domain-containing protein n=1 Tax=Chryseolinea soli TaxID=2321403 RepID=A0A385SIG9_9BACT|nr:T9SS type A sorting domain-containing protein [Chryseolinea soli]AYB29715.1 T9SS C-terminal target domain-containing protein [Chryseolinea soli]